jgi:hypothetical protein
MDKPTPMEPPTLQEAQDYQRALLARIRQPKKNSLPHGLEAGRVAVYEGLLWNNIRGFVDSCFPIGRKKLGKKEWKKWIRRFFAAATCTSPLFRDIPAAFLAFVQQHPKADKLPDYLFDLLHYEWLELAVETAPDVAPEQQRLDGLVWRNRLLVPPSSQLGEYAYPVQSIGKKTPLPVAASTWLLVYRDWEECTQVLQCSAASAILFQVIQQAPMSGKRAARLLAEALNVPLVSIEDLIQTELNQWQRLGVLRGYCVSK